jgi:hypothetical protein
VMVRLSVAVHRTVVVPPGKRLPDTGVQARVTGACPPVVVGALNDTDTGWPSADCASLAGGQVIVNCGTGGGPIGPSLPQPQNAVITRTMAACLAIREPVRIRALE